MTDLIRLPDRVRAYCDGAWRPLGAENGGFSDGSLNVRCEVHDGLTDVFLRAPGRSVERVELRFDTETAPDVRILGDAWERAYGDLHFEGIRPERVLPWYFIAVEGEKITCCGVRTQPDALCFWQVDARGVSLTLDVRCGACGVELGDRELHAATVSALYADGEPLFAVMKKFCRSLCDRPLMPDGPVYGGNNWYYAYGVSSQRQILDDARRIAALAPADGARPFMVIDSCWQKHVYDANGRLFDLCAGGPAIPNVHFGDMAKLAADIRSLGVRPGIWIRPVQMHDPLPEDWLLPAFRTEPAHDFQRSLDPTVPEARDLIREQAARLTDWGYELIKYDFSTNDILDGWGRDYHADVCRRKNWHFADRSVTTAQAFKMIYRAMYEGTGGRAMLEGCNVIGHLAAGLIHLQRTGDDTSGKEWERTRYMGVNTLAFRMCQDGAFFAVDADCVGLTRQVPWALNAQWLDALARSGTPLFVSAEPEAMGPEQTEAVRRAFRMASRPQRKGEPLDLLNTSCPEHWLFESGAVDYDWQGGFAALTYPEA